MASIQELTAQVVALTDQVQTLTGRLQVAEQSFTAQVSKGGGSDSGVFDKKRLYPKEFKETTSFRSWAERFIAWLAMDDDEVARAFLRAGKQEQPLDSSDLTAMQLKYSRAVYGHLRSLTENCRKAAKIVRLVKAENGLEAWRRLVKKYDPQNPEVHAAQLENIVNFGHRNLVKSIADVPTVLDQFQRALDDYEEATGDAGINDQTKKTIMMQLLPPALKSATRDTLMAARYTVVSVSPDYLATVICQRCEFDDAAMGNSVPMEAGAVADQAADDAGSLGQRGVGPGLGKGGPPRAPVAPTARRLPPGGTGGWDKYDKYTNNGFPAGTCGGCGDPNHFRNDCPLNPNKVKFPPRKGKGKGKDKGKWGKGVGGVDDEGVGDAEEGEQGRDGQQDDEGGSVWEDDEECAWAVEDIGGASGARYFVAQESESEDEDCEGEAEGFDMENDNQRTAEEMENSIYIYQPLGTAAESSSSSTSCCARRPQRRYRRPLVDRPRSLGAR